MYCSLKKELYIKFKCIYQLHNDYSISNIMRSLQKKLCTFCIYFSPSGTFVVEFCSFVLVPSVELWRVLRRGGRRRFWAGGTLKHSHMVRLRRFHHRNGVCVRPKHWRQRSPGGAPVLPFEGSCNNAIVSALNSSDIIG